MDKDRLNQENEELNKVSQAAEDAPLPEEEAFPAAVDEDLGEELSEEELNAEPAVYEEEAPAPVERKWDRKKKKGGIPKRYRPLILAFSAVLVLALVYVGVRVLFPEEVPEEQEDAGGQYDYLVQYDSSEIAALAFEFSDGYSYEVKLSRSIADTGYTQTTYTVTGKTEYEYDTTAFSSLLSAASKITSATTAVEAPEDLSVYGLADPVVRVTYTDLEGEKTVILVGDKAPVGTGYYAMLEGGEKVYVIGSYNASYLLYKDMYYRKLSVTSYTDVTSEIDSVQIVRPDGELLVRRQTEEEREEAGIFATEFQIKVPVDTACNNVYLERYILSYLMELSALSVVEDRPADLAKYGLAEENEPVMVEILNADGTSKRLYLGDTTEDGSVYVRINGITSVYTFASDSFAFINTTYNDLMDVALWTYMIDTVESVEMELAGESHVLAFSDVTNDSLNATLDGEEISEHNGRMLYTRILQIYCYDVLPEGAEPGEIVYSFKINFTDGTAATLEFAKVGERTFAVIRNGQELGIYSRISDFQSIIDGIADIKIGYSLERVF